MPGTPEDAESVPPRPRARRLPARPSLDALLDEAYLNGGYEAAGDVALAQLGWRPHEGQLAAAIGRHAWLIGEHRGNQTYQLRMVRLGRDMPVADPDGSGADVFLDQEQPEARHFASIDRHFGVEIEYNAGRDYQGMQAIVAQLHRDHQVQNFGGYAPHRDYVTWRMGSDATVTGGELTSPIISGIDGHNQVRLALRAVRENGGVAGHGQGLHVHHDVRDHTSGQMARLWRNLWYAQDALLAYVPRYRWDGTGGYRGNRMPDLTFRSLIADAEAGVLRPRAGSGGSYRGHYHRYVAFNPNAVLVYGSVEFRALGNTLNGQKIKTWIRVGQALIWAGLQGWELTGPVDSQALMDELVAQRALPRREAERFMSVINTRAQARTA